MRCYAHFKYTIMEESNQLKLGNGRKQLIVVPKTLLDLSVRIASAGQARPNGSAGRASKEPEI